MRVLITENAYSDIIEFKKISKLTDNTMNSYIKSLFNFTMELGKFPNLGKYEFTIQTNSIEYSIRQLIYKKHKILYYVDNAVHIIGFIHTKQDIKLYVKKIKKYIGN